jgi:hypothetical protein
MNSYILENVSVAAGTLGPTNNDLPWNDVGTVYIGTQTGASAITGIVAPVVTATVSVIGSSDGQTTRRSLLVINDSSFSVTFNHQDVGSAAANRIITGSGAPGNLTIASGGNVTLTYDPQTSRWRVTAKMP